MTCHRLDGSIVFLVDAQNLPLTNLSGRLKGVIFPRPVVRPTPGYRFYIQSNFVSAWPVMNSCLPSLWTKYKTTLFIQCNKEYIVIGNYIFFECNKLLKGNGGSGAVWDVSK